MVVTERIKGEQYILKSGNTGAQRLAIVNSAYGQGSRALLLRAGVGPGMRVADFGCGTGHMSSWIAQQVRASGHVTGIDLADDSLRLAQALAIATGMGERCTFTRAEAYHTGLPDHSFDITYCRLLLLHLTRPQDAIREMIRVTRPGGVVVCEDIATRLATTEPDCEPLRNIQQQLAGIAAKKGTDWDIGLKLPRIMLSQGLASVQQTACTPIFMQGEEKRLAEYTFLEAAPMMIGAGLLDEGRARDIGAALRAFTDSADTSVWLPPMVQVVGRVQPGTP